MYKFLLIDNNEILKSSISTLISNLNSKNVVFETESLRAAKPVIDFYDDINIVILNLAALNNGLDETIRFLLENIPAAKLLVITQSVERKYIDHLIYLGVLGIISISSNQNDLKAAIRSVLNEQKYISSTILNPKHSIPANRFNNGN